MNLITRFESSPFFSLNDPKLKKENDSEPGFVIDTIDSHAAVINICKPVFMTIKSFMENTGIDVYHK